MTYIHGSYPERRFPRGCNIRGAGCTITDMRPRWVLLIGGHLTLQNFSVRHNELYEMLDAAIRARSCGYTYVKVRKLSV